MAAGSRVRGTSATPVRVDTEAVARSPTAGPECSVARVGQVLVVVACSVVQRIPADEHLCCALAECLERRDVPAERVGEANDHVEERGDVDRVHERLLRHALGQDGPRVSGRELVRSKRQLLDEAERGADPPVDRSGAPVVLDSAPDVLTERVRRDRSVGVRSKMALVERRDEGGEQLALAGVQSDGPRIAASRAAE